MSDSRVVEVFRAKNATQAHMLANALEEAGIKAEDQGESLNTLSLTTFNLITDSPYGGPRRESWSWRKTPKGPGNFFSNGKRESE